MAKPDKAQITYTIGSGENEAEKTIRFHAVMTEGHEAMTKITSYPTQAGFSISNHAIKQNRRLSIRGVVTNHVIAGAEEFDAVNSSNSKLMFSVLEDLTLASVPCTVTTNLGKYYPMVFNRIKTEQSQGSTDILDFILSGEEIQIASYLSKSTPALLAFTPLSGEEKQARIDKLRGAGIPVPDDAILEEADYNPSGSFQMECTSPAGKSFISTYEQTGANPVTGKIEHLVHTSDIDVAIPSVEGDINWIQLIKDKASALPSIPFLGSANTVSACLKDGAKGLINEAGDELISTSLGKLKKSIYGAAYGTFGVNGDTSFGQVLLSLGAECFVAGAVGTPASEFNKNDLPTVTDMMKGASKIGGKLRGQVTDVTKRSKITKISSPNLASNYLGGVL